MKTNEEINEYLSDIGIEECTIFDNPSYATAFIGVTTDERAVYDHDLMVQFLVDTENMEYEEAVEFISYNTIRALSYIPAPPHILYRLSDILLKE